MAMNASHTFSSSNGTVLPFWQHRQRRDPDDGPARRRAGTLQGARAWWPAATPRWLAEQADGTARRARGDRRSGRPAPTCAMRWPAPASRPPPGREAVVAAAALPADWTMAAITGRRRAGLHPGGDPPRRLCGAGQQGGAGLCRRRHAARGGAGRRARCCRSNSEHNAIFQSLDDANRGAVEKIVLTASGGPFRTGLRGDGARHAGGGAAPPGLVDGRQDQHQFRDDDEQGAGGDRGRPPVRSGRVRDRAC